MQITDNRASLLDIPLARTMSCNAKMNQLTNAIQCTLSGLRHLLPLVAFSWNINFGRGQSENCLAFAKEILTFFEVVYPLF